MIKIFFKKMYVSKDLLRMSKLNSKHFKTQNNSTLILPLFLWKIILKILKRQWSKAPHG